LRGTTDDIGVDLRTTFKALRRFGAPPAHLWIYDVERFCRQPLDPFLFGFARDYQDFRYFRVDEPTCSQVDRNDNAAERASKLLSNLKSSLAVGFPVAFGFHVPATISDDGLVVHCNRSKMNLGGQATLAVGFDDGVRIASHKGALLVRNSWGSRWGDNGYGWLPYDLVASAMADEFWMITSSKICAAALEW
jgi:C1A family cysteine protease